MEINKAISLIDHPIASAPVTWADLGCGNGTFTEALAHLLPKESLIFAMDRNKAKLNHISNRIAGSLIQKIVLDFESETLPVTELNGILMANSLHFVKRKESFLSKIRYYLRKEGSLVIVEYDRFRSNPWVPFPINFVELRALLTATGFDSIRELNVVSSRYGRTIYSALAVKMEI